MNLDDAASPRPARGFLEHGAELAADKYREQAKGLFDLAGEINLIGETISARAMTAVPRDARNSEVRAATLLFRTLQSFQGGVILCERGMATEARMVFRSCFENLFCLTALIKDPQRILTAFESDHKHTLKAFAKFLSSSNERMDRLNGSTKKLVKHTASTADYHWGKVRQLSIDDIAKGSAVSNAYLFYRKMSADSAHPSYSSLDRFLSFNGGDSWQFNTGPQPAEVVSDTLNIGCLALIGVLVAFTQFVNDDNGNRDVGRIAKCYAQFINIEYE